MIESGGQAIRHRKLGPAPRAVRGLFVGLQEANGAVDLDGPAVMNETLLLCILPYREQQRGLASLVSFFVVVGIHRLW